MINATCLTPDKYNNYKWPPVFAALPRKGDKVQGETDEGSVDELTVTEIIHTVVTGYEKSMRRESKVPHVIIVLEKV